MSDHSDSATTEVAPTPDSSAVPPEEGKRGGMQRLLDGIEKVGNKVPHPAIIFAGLCLLVIVLSAILAAFDISVTYDVAEVVEPAEEVVEGEVAVDEQYAGVGSVVPEPVPTLDDYEDEVVIHEQTTTVQSLLNTEGVRFLFSSFVNNFASFSVVAVVFVSMIGIGVAEEAGMMAALIRKLVAVAPPATLAFIIVFVGGLSSIATDAGYLILVPLGAAAFYSVGKHPLAGLVAAYAGVSAAFAVNVLLTPLDGLLTEVTNEAIALVDPDLTIDLTANLWFSIVSTFAMAIVMTFIVQRITEPALGKYTPVGDIERPEEDIPEGEARGLRFATWGTLATLVIVTLLTVLPDAPLRNPETGHIFNNSPLMDSLIFIITLVFLVAGICFGIGARTISSSTDVINGITKTFAGLSGLIFMLLLISQFIAYFNFSNIPTVVAVNMADFLRDANFNAVWLLIGFVIVIVILDLIMPGALPKWAIFAPIFIPLFIELDVAPQTVLAAYRIGDGPVNVITPLMVYLPFIVLVAQRYVKDAGLGTIISLMLPYTIIVLVAWLLLFVVWYLIGIPTGPGYPVKL